MAARLRAKHQDDVRAKIKTSQLINRLQGHADGKVDLSRTQIKAIEILLKKSIPDLTSTEISGPGGGAINMSVSSDDAGVL